LIIKKDNVSYYQMKTIIRQAKKNELDAIMQVYASCVQGMISQGIDQWDDTYPNKEIIKKDIALKNYYVGIVEDKIVAGVSINNKQDLAYLSNDWQDKTNNFMVIHRLCLAPHTWNKGLGKQMMAFAQELARKQGCTSIRLDTYINNPKAIAFYKRIGYSQRGHIKLKPNKDIYYCFEKILS
jgi:ribosomal protein S18 acetylase RimI-like enzyme